MTTEPQYRTIDLVTIGLYIKDHMSEEDANTLKKMRKLKSRDLETVRICVAEDLTNLEDVFKTDRAVVKRTLREWLPAVIRPEHMYRAAAHEYISVALKYARKCDRARMERSLLFSLGYATKGKSPMEFIQSQHEFVRTEYRTIVGVLNAMEQLDEETEEGLALQLIGQDIQLPSALSSPRIDMRRFDGDGGHNDT